MTTIGVRLREERERLGLNQADFGALVGCSRNTQAYYERDERSPDSKYLTALLSKGIDAWYVLTGNQFPDIGNVTNDELELIKIYRAAPLAIKAAALAALTAGSSATVGSINVTGSGQRVAGRDYHEGKK
ncbi:XRE family transcriptional regulator [Pectobacterium odoriferum]|uniref:XRE family transcriptional regulator n=1 Tax=Pectobacterium odoriferum TaxID=78398 RepID=A0ABR4VPD2_9GAMM|nr:helix-turn-helix transcriptional regulator [Pectobacterium odoriferum]KGA41237.1 XRE family transcriptional regulator [Pectobacterium odoriferum]POE01332.1 transcriptional regulator [Pectobacterium odoriferum]